MARIRMKGATDILALEKSFGDLIGLWDTKDNGTQRTQELTTSSLSLDGDETALSFTLKGNFRRIDDGDPQGKVTKIIARDQDGNVQFVIDQIKVGLTQLIDANALSQTLQFVGQDGMKLKMLDAQGHANGSEGDDEIIGTDMQNFLILFGGDDVAFGRGGVDVIEGWGGNDRIFGGADTDYLAGHEGRDYIEGNGGDDLLNGGRGADELFGNRGIDEMLGQMGRDEMTGGNGADVFLYYAAEETGADAQTRDVITDFSQAEGDKIELSFAPAPDLEGHHSHVFTGTDAFDGTVGQLRYKQAGRGDNARTILEGDMDGDGVVDFQIQLNGHIDLVADDFVLY